MTIQELEHGHDRIHDYYPLGGIDDHTNLSIEFAIEKLYEAVGTKDDDYLHRLANNDTVTANIEMMIQELKKAIA